MRILHLQTPERNTVPGEGQIMTKFQYIVFWIVVELVALFIMRDSDTSQKLILVGMLTAAGFAGYFLGNQFPKFWQDLTKPK